MLAWAIYPTLSKLFNNLNIALLSQVKDFTEQNNGSESVSASVDAGDVKENEKDKEKDAPAGTWNAWLGNTGMKAAGDMQYNAMQYNNE